MPSGKKSKHLRKELMDNQPDPQNTSPQVIVQRGQSFSGPIPDPVTLKGYKEAGADFPERIMKMAEAYNEADVKAINRASFADLIIPIIGQIFSFAITAGGIMACVLLARDGYTGLAMASVIIAFLPIVIGAFRGFRQKP